MGTGVWGAMSGRGVAAEQQWPASVLRQGLVQPDTRARCAPIRMPYGGTIQPPG